MSVSRKPGNTTSSSSLISRTFTWPLKINDQIIQRTGLSRKGVPIVTLHRTATGRTLKKHRVVSHRQGLVRRAAKMGVRWGPSGGPVDDRPSRTGDGDEHVSARASTLTEVNRRMTWTTAMTALLVFSAAACGGSSGDTEADTESDTESGATDEADAVVRDAGWDGIVINGCPIEPNAQCPGADLSKVNLGEANLSGANLAGANLSGSSLMTTNLSGADLTGARLGESFLWQANLATANLTNANLTDAVLDQANLNDADLMGANLTGARLNGTRLVNTHFANTTMPDGSVRND